MGVGRIRDERSRRYLACIINNKYLVRQWLLDISATVEIYVIRGMSYSRWLAFAGWIRGRRLSNPTWMQTLPWLSSKLNISNLDQTLKKVQTPLSKCGKHLKSHLLQYQDVKEHGSDFSLFSLTRFGRWVHRNRTSLPQPIKASSQGNCWSQSGKNKADFIARAQPSLLVVLTKHTAEIRKRKKIKKSAFLPLKTQNFLHLFRLSISNWMSNS